VDIRFDLANGMAVRQVGSDFDVCGDAQGIFELNAEVTHCDVDFGMAKQELHSA